MTVKVTDTVKYDHMKADIQEYFYQNNISAEDSVIIAIGRGGMSVAALISHEIGISNVEYINYSRKRGFTGKSFEYESIINKKVFLVDDFTETGGSLQYIERVLGVNGVYDTQSIVYGALKERKFNIVNHAIKEFEHTPIMPWETKL